MGKYDDIIDLPHHQSSTRPHMSMHDRAAQFSPFAALTGYDAGIAEAGRLTDGRAELEEGEKEHINARLQMLSEYLASKSEIRITFFKPDSRKEGGEYLTETTTVKKIDEYNGCLVLMDGRQIPFDDIYGLEGELFRSLENTF